MTGSSDDPRALRQYVHHVGRRVIVLSFLCLSSCQPALLDPRGPVALADDTILLDSLVIMLAIVVPTIAATLGFAWWFRASNRKAAYWPSWAYSGQLELIVWSVPLMTIILLGGVIWIGAHQLDPAAPLASSAKPLEVQVVSLDWKWLFIYPDQAIASVNQLVVPAGVPIHFSLTSASVMNAFFVPRLGSMIYTMNGMTTRLNLLADSPGDFIGLSSDYSGDGFSGMHFAVHAETAEAFETWVKATRADGPILNRQTYAGLAVQSIGTKPFTYRSAEPGLFQAIVSRELPPGPGPRSGRPETSVSPRTEP